MDSPKIHREELADLVSNPDQKKKTKKKKKKPKSVLTQQEAEAPPSELNTEHKQQLLLPRKPDSSSSPLRDTNSELSPIPDSSVNSKKKRKRKKSALKREEELCPEFPSKIESLPANENSKKKRKRNKSVLKREEELCAEFPSKIESMPENAKDPTQGRKKKKKPKSVIDADDIEKRPELHSLPPKDSEPDREKKKKKKKMEKEKKNQNGVNIIEGSELNTSNAENSNVVLPGLDPSSPKVSEPDQQKKEKKKKKNKNKNSIVNGKGAEPNSGNIEPRKDQGKPNDFRTRRERKFKGNGEVCYFCMKHGHTLGNCPKSPGMSKFLYLLHVCYCMFVIFGVMILNNIVSAFLEFGPF